MHLTDYNCVLCNTSSEESLSHLLLECPFAQQCWGLIDVQIDLNLDPFETLQSIKDQLRVPFFMKIIILLAWTIWKSRNDLIFKQINPSIQMAKRHFKEDFKLLILRAKRSYFPMIEQWIANLN
jgi:hypothetical protein